MPIRCSSHPCSGRADAIRRITCVGLLMGMLLSPQLWLADRLFPLIPVADFLGGWPHWIDATLFGIAMMSLVALAILPGQRPAARALLAGLIAVMAALVLRDQQRWQPWAYQYLLCLLPFLFVGADERALLAIPRFVVVATYLWSGIHKLGAPFARFYETTLADGVLDRAEGIERAIILGVGKTIPVFEILIALLLVVPVARRVGVVLACALHAGILLWKGPLIDNSNSVIWPWNVCMIALVILLFPSGKSLWPSWRSLRPVALRACTVCVAILVGIAPAFSHSGRWPRYLAFHLYSGRGQRLIIGVTPSGQRKLGPAYRPYLHPSVNWPGYGEIIAMTWAFDELNVPVASEDAVFLGIVQSLVADHHLTDADAFFYIDQPMLLAERGWLRLLPSQVADLRALPEPTASDSAR